MASGNLTTRTDYAGGQASVDLVYIAKSPFGPSDDRKSTLNDLFEEITKNITGLAVQFADGATATVSAANKGKLRYLGGTGFQTSANGGVYQTLTALGNSTTGTGSLVRQTSPTLVTPALGVASATSINGLTINASTGTLAIANAKTLTASNTLAFTGTDGSSVNFGAGGTAVFAGAITGSGLIQATNRLLGRTTAGSGAIEELTVTQALDLIGAIQGQILYRGASAWSTLAPGVSGQFLKTLGSGLDPQWATVTSGTTNVFNVKDYGAVGDGVTNDVVAFRLCMAALNSAGGGVFFVPDGTYILQVGQPTVDPNYTLIGGTTNKYAIINFTNSYTQFVLQSPKAHVSVVATYLAQHLSGGPAAPYEQYFLYLGSAFTDYFQIYGNDGTVSLTLSGPTLTGTPDSTNNFSFVTGNLRYTHWENLYIDGFPEGGLLGSSTVLPDGTRQNYASFYRIRAINYGGGGDDLLWYTHGNTVFEECWMHVRPNTYSSHGLYWGADSPYVTVRSCWFKNQNNVASPDTSGKFGIQVRAGSGSNIRHALVIGNLFENCWKPMTFQSDVGNAVEDFHVLYNWMIGGTTLNFGSSQSNAAVNILKPLNCIVAGNYFDTYIGVVFPNASPIAPGYGCTVEDNTCVNGDALCSLSNTSRSNIVGNYYRRTTIDNASAGFRYLMTIGSGGTCEQNTFERNLVEDGGGSAGASGSAFFLNTSNSLIQANIIKSTVSQTYSGLLNVTGNNNRIIANQIDHTGSGTNFITGNGVDVSNNTSNKNISINGTGSTYSTANGNRLTAGQLLLAGLVIPTNNIATSWNTGSLSGAFAGSGNVINGSLDSVSASVGTASYTPHAGVYQSIFVTMTGNPIIPPATNPIDGRRITFYFISDATPGRTPSLNSIYRTNYVPSGLANKIDSVSFVYNASLVLWLQEGDPATGL